MRHVRQQEKRFSNASRFLVALSVCASLLTAPAAGNAEIGKELIGIGGITQGRLSGGTGAKPGSIAKYLWTTTTSLGHNLTQLEATIVYDKYTMRKWAVNKLLSAWVIETVKLHCTPNRDPKSSIGRTVSKTRVQFVAPFPAINSRDFYDWPINETISTFEFPIHRSCQNVVVSSSAELWIRSEVLESSTQVSIRDLWLDKPYSEFELFQPVIGPSATGKATANSNPKTSSSKKKTATPKCSGTNLAKYQKASKQEEQAWRNYLEALASSERYKELTGRYPKDDLDTLTYSNWLQYGRALEKYAKICKMKMRPEWYEMLDSLPVD